MSHQILHTILGFLYISIAIIILIILYRKLIKRLGHTNVNHDLFCVLLPVEKVPASGIIDFCFICKETKKIDFEIITLNFENVVTLASKEFKEGQHILHFDSTTVENGDYFYQLKTDNQQVFKKIRIQN